MPVSGSTYSYAYTTMGEMVAMGVAACLLLEYGVSMSATAIGWGGYLNLLLNNVFGFQLPHALTAAPWGEDPGIINLPATVLIIMCALLLIRGASESAKVNTIMVILKLAVLAMFVAIAFTAFTTDHFAGFWDKGFAGITAAASTIFFTFIGLDAVSTAGDEVKDPQRTMPRAILAALVVVTSIYILVAFAGLGTQSAEDFGSDEQSEAGLSVILQNLALTFWGPDYRSVQTSYASQSFIVGNVAISATSLYAFIVAFVMAVVLIAFLQFLRDGKALRAMVQNRYAASLMGVNT